MLAALEERALSSTWLSESFEDCPEFAAMWND